MLTYIVFGRTLYCVADCRETWHKHGEKQLRELERRFPEVDRVQVFSKPIGTRRNPIPYAEYGSVAVVPLHMRIVQPGNRLIDNRTGKPYKLRGRSER